MPVFGAAGEVVVDEPLEPLPIEPLELPLLSDELLSDELVPPLELDLLKWASHSAREIWPSPLVSTDEKLGVEALPELELGSLELPPAAALPEDLLGVVADGDADEPLEDLALSAATARPDRTKSAAAVVTVTVLSIASLLCGWGSHRLRASGMPRR